MELPACPEIRACHSEGTSPGTVHRPYPGLLPGVFCFQGYASPSMTRGTAIPTPISCLPCGRWTKPGNGFPRAGRSTTLTRTASVSGLRPADGKATRRTPWTGTTRSTPRYGGRAGLTRRTAIWKPSAARSALTFAPMPDKGLIKSPLSTWGQRSVSWRRKAYRPTSAT